MSKKRFLSGLLALVMMFGLLSPMTNYAVESNSRYGDLLAELLSEGTYTDEAVDSGLYEYTVVGSDGSIATVDVQNGPEDMTGIIDGFYEKVSPSSAAPEVPDGIYIIVGAHSGNANYAITANTDLTRENVASLISNDRITTERVDLEWNFAWADTGYKMESVSNPGMYMTFTETDSNNGVTIQETSSPQLLQLDYVGCDGNNQTAYPNSVHVGGIVVGSAPRASYLNFRGNRIGSYNGGWNFPDAGSAFYLYEKDYVIRTEKVAELTAAVGSEGEYSVDSWSAYSEALVDSEVEFETLEDATVAYKALVAAIEGLESVDPDDVAEKVYTKVTPNFNAEQPVADDTYVIVGAHTDNDAAGKVITRGSSATSFTCPSISSFFEDSERIIRTNLPDAEWKFAYQGTVNNKKTYTISATTASGTVYLDTSSSLTTTTTQTALNVVDTSSHYAASVGIGSDAASNKYLNYNQATGNVGLWSVDPGSTWYLYAAKYDIKDAKVEAATAGVTNEADYTPESWSAYQDALEATEGLFATEGGAVAAYDALVAAVAALAAPTPEATPEATPEVTEEPTPEVTTEPTPEPVYTPEVVFEKYTAGSNPDQYIEDGTYVIAGAKSSYNLNYAVVRTETINSGDTYPHFGYNKTVTVSNNVMTGDLTNAIWEIKANEDGTTYTISVPGEEKYLTIANANSKWGVVTSDQKQAISIAASNTSGAVTIGAASLANGTIGYMNNREINSKDDAIPGTYTVGAGDTGSAWYLYKATYKYDMKTLYEAIRVTNAPVSGDPDLFLYSEDVYTRESGLAYRDTLKTVRGTFATEAEAKAALDDFLAAVRGLTVKEDVKSTFPEITWTITQDISIDGTPNYVSNLPYVNTSALDVNGDGTNDFDAYEALTWDWLSVQKLVDDQEQKIPLEWITDENGISYKQFSQNETSTWSNANVYKISGTFLWPKGYDLADTTIVLDSKNDFFYRDVYEYLSEEGLDPYFPLGQVLPINDDVYVVVWAGDESAKPTIDTINDSLAFWAGTSGKGAWSQKGNTSNDWGRTESATFIEWNIQGERTFRYSYPNIIGTTAIENVATANGQVQDWNFEYIDHSDGWYTLTDTTSLNSVLRNNYGTLEEGTEVHIDLYVMNNSGEGFIDELEIELFTTEHNDVTVNYYLNEVADHAFLGSEQIMNVEDGEEITILPGVRAGQLNSYKAEAIYQAGYKEVTDGVQQAPVPYIVDVTKDNVINVVYTVKDAQTIYLVAPSKEVPFNGEEQVFAEAVAITENGYDGTATLITEGEDAGKGAYRLPDGNIIYGVFAEAAGTNPGDYENAFVENLQVGAIVIRNAAGDNVTGTYAIMQTPGTLTITPYEPTPATLTYDFAEHNEYALGAMFNTLEAKAVDVSIAENQSVTLENGTLSYEPTVPGESVTADLTLKFNDTYSVTKQVKIVPASTVLYGDHYMDRADATVWVADGKVAKYTVDDNEESVYGYTADVQDASFSNGSALKATLDVNGNSGITGITAKTDALTFTFTGTGFDLLSACGPDTGMVVAKVTDENGAVVDSYLVDTYFVGDMTSDEDVDPIIGSADAFTYQTPVVRKLDLPYGTYTVTVYGYLLNTSGALRTFSRDEAAIPTEDLVMTVLEDLEIYDVDVADVEISFMSEDSVLNGGSGNLYAEAGFGGFALTREGGDATEAPAGKDSVATVYVDGFRVYQPLTKEQEAAAYVPSEQGTEYYSVYDFIKTSVNDLGAVVENAVIYMEYDGNTGVTSIADYKIQGPQNEVYLTGENAIAFAVDGYEAGDVVQVGAKLVTPGATLSSDNGATNATLYATEMYYGVTVQTANGMNYVVIKNTGAANSVLALSGLKVSDHIGIYASAEVGEQILKAPIVENEDGTVTEVKVTTADEVLPDRFFTVRVETSTDVSKVELVIQNNIPIVLTAENMQAVEAGAVDVYRYSHSLRANADWIVDGAYNFTVIAYDANGNVVATQPVVVGLADPATVQ